MLRIDFCSQFFYALSETRSIKLFPYRHVCQNRHTTFCLLFLTFCKQTLKLMKSWFVYYQLGLKSLLLIFHPKFFQKVLLFSSRIYSVVKIVNRPLSTCNILSYFYQFQNKLQMVDPINFEDYISKNKTLLQNDPHRELLVYPSDDVSVSYDFSTQEMFNLWFYL